MLEVILLSPQKVLFEGKARSLILPGEQGVFEALSYHKPLLSRLISGRVIIDNEKEFSITRGIAGINLNKATVIIEE
ncbi:MAG TPA: hypothetical protein DCL49_10385 [Candidatus Omnitrophica bacterium]|nr:MAG: hypothetical protein A2062_04750 [Omnitrophica WOR_2 bacterium GWA2_44_7]HAH21295.1 hypothetical protein [Candidatus Omnitrophota bacterium]HBG63893.1 hypothetical protein [Candidatus Omnitrophota bacterium]HCD39192.1 hypothetical protein [Candidatus Omnitrophota bacterium]